MTDKSSVQQDRQRSQLLKKQLHNLGEDFQYMKKNKDEWKKQLDARFQDIEKKIQASKQFISNEAKRTNDTLLAFQHKFQFQLKKTKDELQSNIDNLNKQTTANFSKKSEEIAQLNKDLQEQKNNRNSQFEDGMKDNKQRMDSNLLINSRTQRSAGKGKIKQNNERKVEYGKNKRVPFFNKVTAKGRERREKLKTKGTSKAYRLRVVVSTKIQRSGLEFHNKTFNEFKQSLGDLRTEMQARFNSKDQIINSLSKIVRTLQDTLRHPN